MTSKKEPPDKYRCLKLPITSILITDKDKEKEVQANMDTLQSAILRTNAITTKTYFCYDYGLYINIIVTKKFL